MSSLVKSPPPPTSARPFVALCAATLFGVGVGWGILRAVTPHLSNEMQRASVLLRQLSTPSGTPPTMVVVGNSVAMNGVDTHRLGEELNPPREIWNLATTGQTQLEGALLMDVLNPGVKEILYCATVQDLVYPLLATPRSKLTALRLYGFTPGPFVNALGPDSDAIAVLTTPAWRIPLEARWMLRSALDDAVRSSLRTDLAFDRATNDLYYPAPYTQRLAAAPLARLVQRAADGRQKLPTPPLGRALRSILALRDTAGARGIELKVVVLPENPDLRALTPPGLYQNAAQIIQRLQTQGVTVWTFDNLLPATDFVDDLHPGAQGATKLTDALAQKLSAQTVSAPPAR